MKHEHKYYTISIKVPMGIIFTKKISTKIKPTKFILMLNFWTIAFCLFSIKLRPHTTKIYYHKKVNNIIEHSQ